MEFDVSHAYPPRTPAEIESALAAALERVAAELAEVAKALAKIEALLQFIASAAATK